MSRLADPTVCPDCRGPLDSHAVCTRCGLRLWGTAAAQLWATMNSADRLVEQLRTAPVPHRLAPTGRGETPAATRIQAPPYPTTYPVAARPPHPSTSRRLGPTAPVVLLGLGAVCLVVAAIVFVVVAWSSLGLGAKATILLGLTAVAGGCAVWAGRRGLRGTTETLWTTTAILLVIDLLAAWGADLPGTGSLTLLGIGDVVGGALLLLGAGVGLGVRGRPFGETYSLAGCATFGALLLATTGAWLVDHDALATTLAIAISGALALALVRRLPVTAYGVGAVGVLSWLVLALPISLDRIATSSGDATWWHHLSGWPLVAAAGYAALGTVRPLFALAPRTAPYALRFVAAAVALACVGVAVAGPSGGPTSDVATWAGITLGLAAAAALAPRIWRQAAAALTLFAGVCFAVLLLSTPLARVALLPSGAPAHGAHLGLRLPVAPGGPAAWTVVLTLVVVVACSFVLLRHLPRPWVPDARTAVLLAVPATTLLAGADLVVAARGSITLVATVLLVATTAAVGAALAQPRLPVLLTNGVLTAYLVVLALRVAAPSHALSAATAGVTVVVLTVGYAVLPHGSRHAAPRAVLGCCATLLLGLAVWHLAFVLGADAALRPLVLVVTAAVVGLAARRISLEPAGALALEAGAVMVALAALSVAPDLVVAASVLTVIGTAVSLATSLHEDRANWSWLSVPVLGLATVLRVSQHVTTPEAVALPAAVVLLTTGLWRMRRDPSLPSLKALGSGLTLGLAPSLLLALPDPVSLRGALVGAAGVVVLGVGIAQRWQAPFGAGAVVVGLLALRHLGPIAEAVPRFASLGLLGLALLAVGISWERRRRDLVAAGAYLAALR